jgi:pyridoxine 5-phosphate synthase
MHRLGLDIDPIAYVRNLMNTSDPDPVHVVVLGELGGAESVVCYLRDDLKTVSDRDVALLKQVVKTYFNVRANLTENTIRKLLRVKPDMITFVSPAEMGSVACSTLDLDTYATQLSNYVAELRSNNILSSALIEPDINQVKIASKLELDYIELSAFSYSSADDMNDEAGALEHLTSMTLGASKLGLGVNVSGGLGYDNVQEISRIDYVEDIIIGEPIFNKALLIGIEQAVRDLISQF